MGKLTIGYNFIINVAVRKRNGKTYKSHSVNALGFSYAIALHDAYLKLKKRGTTLLSVNSVKVCRIAFAIMDGKSVAAKLSENMPEIPEDLNEAIKYLPKS